MIKIDKGIPIPKRKGGRSKHYPWDDMEVGDCVVALKNDITYAHGVASRATARYKPKKFIVRELEGKVRIWRKE